jgi:hypothetical protein
MRGKGCGVFYDSPVDVGRDHGIKIPENNRKPTKRMYNTEPSQQKSEQKQEGFAFNFKINFYFNQNFN